MTNETNGAGVLWCSLKQWSGIAGRRQSYCDIVTLPVLGESLKTESLSAGISV